MSVAHVKNWKQFQHYKNRNPPWVKLHKGLLDDFEFSRLHIASKALAPLVWLLASESNDGTFEADAERLAFRLRWNVEDVRVGLSGLIERGFVICASDALADCKQVARPETERDIEKKKDQELVPHSAKSRAARLPQDWQPTVSEMRWAADARPDVDARAEVEKFRDYWHAKAGRDACKRDWPATWRNWIRNSRGSNHAIGRSNRAEGHESVADRAARFAREGNEADARRAAANRCDASLVGEDGGDLRASVG